MYIATDIDNVLLDIIASARIVLADKLGLQTEDVKLTDIYEAPFANSDPEIQNRINEITGHSFWNIPEILVGCPIFPNAPEAIEKLSRAGLFAGYITRRPNSVAQMTQDRLDHFGFPVAPVLHVGSDNQDTHFKTCKSTACQKLHATHLMDDHATEIETAHSAGIEVLVIDAPTGRDRRHEILKICPAPLFTDVMDAVESMIDLQRQAA